MGKMAIQSMMFSSTWQILESYLEDSPSSIRKTPQEASSWKEHVSPTVDTKTAATHADVAENSKSLPETPDSSRPSSQSNSVANSPASSKTSASFTDEYPLKIIPRKEIRLRRTPQGAEPRVKNLMLTRSNGATNLKSPASETHPNSATSNYDKSPAIESPPDLPRPPPPPPKLFDTPIQRVAVARKPVQASSVARANKATPNSKPMGNLLSFNNAAPAVAGDSSAPKAPVDPPYPRSSSRRENRPASNSSKPGPLPPRSDSLVKGVSIAKFGLRPAHKKSASSMSQNKELPPSPPQAKLVEPPMLKQPSYARLPEGFFELPSQSSGKELTVSDSKGQSNAGLNIFNSLRAESPLPDIAELETPAENSNPFEATSNEVQNAPLRSESRGAIPPTQREPRRPGFTRTETSTSQGSNSSTVTSSSLTAPFSQPSLRSRGRAPSNSDQRARSRSHSNSSQNERFKSPQQSQNSVPPRTTSSSSISALSQKMDVPLRSTTPQIPRSNTPQTSGSLPGVPEVRSPLIAPELKPSHFSCYTQHRPLLLSSNVMAPILCMTCKQDSEQMWKCGWCCLRICTGCKGALGEVRGNLKRMLAGAESGQLKIGRDRVFEASLPIERSNTPASIMSNNSNPRSQLGSSKGPSPNMSQGQLPRSGPSPMLNTGQFPSRGPSPNQMQGRPPPRNMPNGLRPGPPPSNLRPGPSLLLPPPPMNDPMQPPPQPMRPRANSNRSDFSFERVSSPTVPPPKVDNSKPLPPPGLPRGIGAPFGNIPIGISAGGSEMRRPVPLPSKPRKAGKKFTYKDDDYADGDGQATPDFDLGFDVGPGGMAAGMRGMNPNMAGAGPKLPPNPVMGLGIGSLSNGKPRGLRDRLLMT